MVLSEDQVLDWCDRLYLIVEPESRIVRSLWPAQPPAFSDVLREYTARCREVTGVVLASVARLLGLHEGRFVGMMDEGVAMTHARFNYYPRCPEPDRVFGLKPHSDASVITVVLIDDVVGGLQVQKPNDDDGVWYNVPIVPNALLVNVGDVTEIMSNGLFRSPVHRAVTNAESDRVSLAMFYTLDTEKEIEPLPEPGAGGRQEAEAVQEDHDQGLSGGAVREVQQRGTSLGHGEDRPQRRLKTCMILERQLTMIDGR